MLLCSLSALVWKAFTTSFPFVEPLKSRLFPQRYKFHRIRQMTLHPRPLTLERERRFWSIVGTTDKSKDNHKPTLLARMLSFLFLLHVWHSDLKQALWIVYVTVTISCYFNRCLQFLKMCKSTLSLLCTDCSGEAEEWSHTAELGGYQLCVHNVTLVSVLLPITACHRGAQHWTF